MNKKIIVKTITGIISPVGNSAHIVVPKMYNKCNAEIKIYGRTFKCKICKQTFLNEDYCLDCGKENEDE